MNEKQTKALGILAGLLSTVGPSETSLGGLKKSFRAAVAKDPLDATLVTVAVASALFYRFEKGKNPKVKTFGDALEFVTTNLSVGYCDIFAQTEEGKLVTSAIMTFGPAMAAGIFDPPKAEVEEKARIAADESKAAQAAVVARLDAILDELRRRPTA